MSFDRSAYRPTPRKVVHETIDGEVIIIQLERGTYFSLSGTGAEVWELLGRGFAGAGIVAELAERYRTDRETVASAVEPVLARLVDEGVLVPDPEAAPNGGGAAGGRAAGPFTAPALERFDDMQDFLLIDPVHEVAESGWPQRGPGA